MRTEPGQRRRGGALLAVLWLAAALSAIAFALAGTVRGEVERAFTALDATRAHYLAAGSIERALLYMQWGPANRNPDGTSRYYTPGTTVLQFSFPSGDALVEILPEASKLSVNHSPVDELARLTAALGVETGQAVEIAQAILDWRTPRPPQSMSVFDQFYLSQVPSFRAAHASFQQIEELLLVKGMTPELFHGRFDRDPEGRLVRRHGLKDCLSVYGSSGAVDVNTAAPPLLAAIGLSPATVAAILERRSVRPFRTNQDLLTAGVTADPASGRLRLGGGSIFTLRATARPRLPDGKPSDLRRSVAALVKWMDGGEPPYRILRWYDSAWVNGI